MAATDASAVLDAWSRIPARIADAVLELDDAQLERLVAKSGFTIREQTHHLVEAQIIYCRNRTIGNRTLFST
jgi:hypothetical protein